MYHAWGAGLDDIEICAVQLPGREGRLLEKPFDSLSRLLDPLTTALSSFLDQPFVIFGHSLGAILGFEVIRELRRRGAPPPSKLIVSGRRAPGALVIPPQLRHLSDERFVEALCREYGGIPKALREDPELLKVFLPALRADFTLLETYVYQKENPLDCPISAVGGTDDRHSTLESLESWRSLTTGVFTTQQLPGGHFYLHADRPSFMKWLILEISSRGSAGKRGF